MPTRLILLLAIVVIAAHGPIVVGGRTWDDAHRIAEVTPAQLEVVGAIGDGRLPGWWDRAGLGAPLWAEPAHGAAYPGWWPAALAADHASWMLDVIAVLHALWAALGAALLARRLGADDLGAVVAGALLGAADVTTAAMVGGTIGAVAHLPWVAWAADGIARAWSRARVSSEGDVASSPTWRRSAGPVAALALAVSAILLAGRLALAFDAVAIALVVALGRGPRRVVAAWTVAAIAIGFALAAIAIVPAVHHLLGDVGARAGAPTHGSPWSLLGAIVPGGETLGGASPARLVEPGGLLGGSVFLGGAMLLLAVAATARGGAGRRALAITAGGLLALGAGALAPWDALVGVDRAAYLPVEHVAAAAVLLAALAGVGFSELAAGSPDRRTLRVVLIAGAALAVALVALGAARPLLARSLDDGDLDAAVARVDRVLAHGAVAVAVALATVALLLASSRRAWPWAIPAAAVLAIGHAVSVGRLIHPTTARADLDATPGLLRAAAASEDVAAVAATGLSPRLYLPVETRGDTLIGAVPARFGIAAARWPAPGRQRIEDALWTASGAAGGRMFDRHAIDLAVVPASIAVPADLPVLGERGSWAMVGTRARRPRALLVHRWAWFDDDVAAIRAIFPAAGEPPLPLTVVARIGDGEPPTPTETHTPASRACDVRADSPERVVVHCDSGRGGMIVLLDAWAPGWSVTVDGEPARLERVDVAARGVVVGDGEHSAVFSYAPPGDGLGRWISGAGVLVLLGLLVGARVRPRP